MLESLEHNSYEDYYVQTSLFNIFSHDLITVKPAQRNSLRKTSRSLI